MLYAVIKRFDSLREITTSLLADTNRLAHLGINFKTCRSTLADANKRRPEAVFEAIYRDLYARHRHVLISDSRRRKYPKWMLQISANAIKIQIWVTLIANLLLMVMQKRLTRSWSFSGLASLVRIVLMYYVDFYSLFNNPEKDWENMKILVEDSPPQPSLFD